MLLLLIGLLLDLIGSLSLLILLVEGNGEGDLIAAPQNRQSGGVAGLVVAGQGGSEGGAGVDGGFVNGGDDIALLQASLLGAGIRPPRSPHRRRR